jgi:mannose-1-phosphate guanylyltransferase/mannose-1-phosphate guanylyltransferase/mannose-6-phosphate isomerase
MRRLPSAPTTILTTVGLSASTRGILNRFQLKAEILGEPKAKNTASAVLLAAKVASFKNPNSVVGVFPADHVVQKVKEFQAVVATAEAAAQEGHIVTIGIRPDHASTAYGYLDVGSGKSTGLQRVRKFIEKPSQERAENLLERGGFLWNAGMFIFRADKMLEAFRIHAPDIFKTFEGLKEDLSNLETIYAEVRAESVDYAVMEKLESLQCVPADIGWSDVGSWEEVCRRVPSSRSEVETEGSGNRYFPVGVSGKRPAFVGLSDVVAVDTPDALLILRKGHGQNVRKIVETLRAEKSAAATTHTFEERPWGRFEVLLDTDHFKSKRITVLPKQTLSYQSHAKRAEHWIVVKGVAEVTLDDVTKTLKAGEHIFIPLGAKHRMANPGQDNLEFIEVQTGTYFGEDDIVRYSDAYGRK